MIIIGHKNPDTDAAVSALVFSKFLKKKGIEAQAFLAGEANKETKFIFSLFEEILPETLLEISQDQKVFLVDHNDLSQSLAQEKNVVGVLDHHSMSGIKTNSPIFFRTEVIGSTSSLVYKLFLENKISLDKQEASLLLAAIISDTLNLNSPTTTEEDRKIYEELKKITNIDADDLAEKMFLAKSDYSDKKLEEVICLDLKEFDFNSKKVVVAVAETTNLDYFYKQEKEIIKSLQKIKKEFSYDYLFFGAVHIIDKETMFFSAEDIEREIVKKLFKGEERDNYFLLKNIVSRKKEIVPILSDHFSKPLED